MRTGAAAVAVAIAVVGGQTLPVRASQVSPPVAGLRELLESAEVIVAAEIAQVDDRATAVDGPLILAATVLAVVKGRVRVGETLRTWEAAQVAGTYGVGQQRLLLLKRQRPVRPYHQGAAWWNMPVGVDVAVEKAGFDALTLEALRAWLDQLGADRAMPAVEIAPRAPRSDRLELDVTLHNPTERVVRFNPSRVTASLGAARRFTAPIAWNLRDAGGSTSLEPGDDLRGRISVPAAWVEGATSLSVDVGHLWLGFPLPRLWVGYVTTEVRLPAPAR
jgi:hypothetical protein